MRRRWLGSLLTAVLCAGPVSAQRFDIEAMESFAARLFERMDLDRDGQVGEPVTELSAIIEQEDGYTRMVRDKLNIDPALINEWAKGIAVGKTLAVNTWTGKGNLFTRAEYDNLLATLSDMGLAENIAGKSWQLTHTGKRWVRGMAE